ncbi:MAG TPA: hypothetical protein PLG15_02125 [Candidatus Gastranaerophilaceae bacterium]|nr:hypothetical protein [Candidatus Gastranaerophilaceae bacterium]HPT41161.1 hypothetical protein [Candidatus Gastranaerophilaceae bacterium]
MELSVPTALDNLAANGVINYDANAYIRGEKPKYGINPQMKAPGLKMDSNAKMQEQPQKDEFKNSIEKIPSWKKILTGVLLVGTAVLLGKKIWKPKNINLKKSSNVVRKPLKDFIAKPISWIKSKIKIKKP